MGYYKFITEDTKYSLNKPHDSDIIYYSELKEWYTTEALRSFSIKCVLQETIHYTFGHTEYAVKPMNYLLSVKQPYVKAYFETPQQVKSLCIDICPQTVKEVFTLLTDKKGHRIEDYLANHFTQPNFLETVYPIGNSVLGKKLQQLIHQINCNKEEIAITKEWFYELMEAVVCQEYRNYIRIENIASLKSSTRKEIYRRVRVAKEYMDENFLNIQNINEISKTCFMSEYHFFRSFKQIYNIAPHQYLQQKKLIAARNMIARNSSKLTEVASLCGFHDISSFSKIFKKYFSITPSSFKKNKQN